MKDQHLLDYLHTFIDQNDCSDDQFNECALTLFSYQYKNNIPFQKYCLQKGKTPRTVKTWQQIPAVPINAFKELTLSCADPATAERIFMTSGTTQKVQGKHYHPSLSVYDLSMIRNFKERFIGAHEKIQMGILFPTEDEMPNSSLAHYLALAVRKFGKEDSQYFINGHGLELYPLMDKMEHVEKTAEPYALLGASYSFVHLLDELENMGKVYKLPSGSKILDTGGFKNKAREIELNAFYDRLSQYLGVHRKNCINMYGMTELSTQFYDDGNDVVPSHKSGPHWIRTRVINPLTGEDVRKGDQGVLVHCDLANFNSVSTILTEDIGIETEKGFLLLGRAKGAEAKGCSLTVEELFQARKGN
ncbi:MAG TPA: long-chain fatty acid--CoA ligase [Desulfosporosinus sp.]|nr:long-chain fatty acid--CoA ligase [Desulfosporosinus sp.]